MNFETHSTLKNYTVVAHAEENILDENEELDGSFTWVVYHNDSTHLFVARVDAMSGDVSVLYSEPYASARDYTEIFARALATLWKRATGRDFSSPCPTR